MRSLAKELALTGKLFKLNTKVSIYLMFLEMTVEQAAETFSAIPQAADRLSTLVDVGLGYVKLGQPAPTLSGGEAQRVKLATELSKRATGKTLYLIDEPTTGLSFYDVHKLMDVIQRLVDKGNSVIVIEHNLDVIRCSDWIIDLGPDGGDKGGEIIAEGIPEDVAKNPTSYTAKYLKKGSEIRKSLLYSFYLIISAIRNSFLKRDKTPL